MERAGDYIFDGNSKPHRLVSPPEYIPVENITDPDDILWMKKRSPKVQKFSASGQNSIKPLIY